MIYAEDRACHYISLAIVDWIDLFVRPVYKQIIVHSLNHFIVNKGLQVYSWCLMMHHLEIIIETKEGTTLQDWEDEFKAFTTHKIIEALDTEPDTRKKWMLGHFEKTNGLFSTGKKSQVWQADITPISLNTRKISPLVDYIEKIQQMPVRDRIVDVASDYLYSSARDYTGLKGLVNIIKLRPIEQQLAALESMNGGFFVKYVRN